MEAQAVALERRLFTVDEYERLVTVGILTQDDRVELLEGEIVNMSPIGAPHAGLVTQLNALLNRLLGDRALISVQSPIRLSNTSEPQPDLVVLRPRPDFYKGAHPNPADVLLLIEVADSTLAIDKGIKVPLYARGMIPEVWVIDVNGQLVWQYLQPGATGYQIAKPFGKGDTLSAAALTGVSLNINDLFA